ncbi:MAG: Na/Pi symporter [Pseudomonadales bacterium]|nr:Na/Pi symporter [Pseudomonadales bacterium]
METVHILMAGVTAIILFVFGLEHFSREIEQVSGERFRRLLGQATSVPVVGLAIGAAVTALIQSSSVTTGLAIIFTQQGILGLENAVPIIMGANIGTTVTAFVAALNMDLAAKKTAFCHFLFNVGGVLLFLPLLLTMGHRLGEIEIEPALALANIHLVFNLVASFVFLLLIDPFSRFIDRMFGEGEMDFRRIDLPSDPANEDFEQIREHLSLGAGNLYAFLQENYSLVTLSIETNYGNIVETASKRLDYFAFVKREYMNYFVKLASIATDQEQSRSLMKLVQVYDYLFQIHDSISDIFETKRVIDAHYLELEGDVLILCRELSGSTLGYFEDLSLYLQGGRSVDVKGASAEVQRRLNETHVKLLRLLANSDRKDVGALTNVVTYSQRLKDKLDNYRRLVDPDQ